MMRAIRVRYPVACSEGGGDCHGRATQADEPTHAWPGSEEKIAVLTERAARRQELWHPEDGRGLMT